MNDNVVYPGMCLGPADACSQKENVYTSDTLLYSAVIGIKESSSLPGSDKPIITVKRIGEPEPSVGSIVFAKISKLSRKYAECNILVIDGRPLQSPYKGVIMNTNIHESKSIDSTIYEWFKLGDIVKAMVISDSDLKQIVLSTAKRNLGVVRIESDEEMIPISWKFFLGRKSGKVEKRKVAKPETDINQPHSQN